MIKLYKNVDGFLHYFEWWKDKRYMNHIHWGKVGTKGKSETIPKYRAESRLEKRRSEGCIEFDQIPLSGLVIEYKITDFGDVEDLEKRHKLEDIMNEVLGWTGLGHCDGGSIGSGTMEVYCIVIDFEKAEKVVARNLKNTEFSNYTKIYESEISS